MTSLQSLIKQNLESKWTTCRSKTGRRDVQFQVAAEGSHIQLGQPDVAYETGLGHNLRYV